MLGRFPRFLFAGALHNVAGYGLYLLLNLFLPYAAAYTVSYGSAVLVSFILNRRFVFKSSRSVSATLLPFFALHLSAYIIAIGLVTVLVEFFATPEWMAPLLATAVLTVYMFFGTRFVMGTGRPARG